MLRCAIGLVAEPPDLRAVRGGRGGLTLSSSLLLLLSLALLEGGCGLLSYSGPGSGADGGSGLPPGTGVGGACSGGGCRAGLLCSGTTCQPGHASRQGTPCVLSDECAAGLYCGPARTCAPAGSGAPGSSCGSDADCGAGLRCNLVGFATACQPEGLLDAGGSCSRAGDCLAGLACAAGHCAPLPMSPGGTPPIALPGWAGVECSDDPGPVKAYFRVPRGSGDGDFYRLPFPNDIRKKGLHLDLGAHPTPGAALLGFDPVDRYLRDLEHTATGFSTSPSLVMRFSGAIDFSTLRAPGAVRLLDLTKGAPAGDLGYFWQANSARNRYLCENNLVLRPPRGAPLTEGHTYAVLLGSAIRTAAGAPVVADSDFTALVGPEAPAAAELAAAWKAYRPLRDWLASRGESPSSLLDAAVFTVGQPSLAASLLGTSVGDAPAPVALGWVKCGSAPSPCPQASGDRACGPVDPAFDELHALVTLPIFQKGTPPYREASDGGDLDWFPGQRAPALVRTEAVCMALTVPRGVAMPPQGWPLVIYAHGTGGSFRSGVVDLGARLASVPDDNGAQVHMAVLGIDQVEHGPRRGASSESPSTLFYNLGNPLAARGNSLQGAADQISLLRFAAGLKLSSGQSPTGSEIRFGSIAFWGHSQGAAAVSMALPYLGGDYPPVAGVVLSGQGAGLVDSLLAKKNPVNIAAAVPLVLADPEVDVFHPVLGLLQNDLDPVDPLNHALALAAIPPRGVMPRHLFQPFGQGDTFAPPLTEVGYAVAALLGVAQPPPSVKVPTKELTDLGPQPVPLGGNLAFSGTPITAVVREYASDGSYDGHFVAFQNPDARRDVDHFLADAQRGGVAPKVGR